MKLGFIGIGLMGRPMTLRLLGLRAAPASDSPPLRPFPSPPDRKPLRPPVPGPFGQGLLLGWESGARPDAAGQLPAEGKQPPKPLLYDGDAPIITCATTGSTPLK